MQFGAKVRYFLLSRNLLFHKSLESSLPVSYSRLSGGAASSVFRACFFFGVALPFVRNGVASSSPFRAVVFGLSVCFIYIMVKTSVGSLPLQLGKP